MHDASAINIRSAAAVSFAMNLGRIKLSAPKQIALPKKRNSVSGLQSVISAFEEMSIRTCAKTSANATSRAAVQLRTILDGRLSF